MKKINELISFLEICENQKQLQIETHAVLKYCKEIQAEQLRLYAVTTRFSPALEEMKKAIIESLSKLNKGFGKRKSAIEKDTGIPIDILTVLLKQLKIEGKIELIMIWSEEDSTPNGSGYCLTGNLIN